MGFIERTYTSTMAYLAALGQSQYQAVASEIAVTAQILSSLVAVIVLVNMALQIRPMDALSSIWLILKFVLVALFLQSWADFNGVFEAIDDFF